MVLSACRRLKLLCVACQVDSWYGLRIIWFCIANSLQCRGVKVGILMPRVCLVQRFQRRERDEGRRDGGRDSGAGADRERQRRERLQQQKRGQWNAYWQDKNAPRIVYNSSVICYAWLLSLVKISAYFCWLWIISIVEPSSSCITLMLQAW